MKFDTIPILKGSLSQVQGNAVFRLSLGQGCSLPGCNCSPGNWMWVSNGKVSFAIKFDEEEAKQIREGKLFVGDV